MSHELETRSAKELAGRYKRTTIEQMRHHTRELVPLYKEAGDDGVENAEANIVKYDEAINILIEDEIRNLNKK